MKIFDQVEPWPSKVNFVDKNNVMVGYDMGQCCCEMAGYYLSEERMKDTGTNTINDVEDYIFDTDFFERVEDAKGLDEGEMVRFRLTAPDKPDLYLHLYNCHNGYYWHGFTFSESGMQLFSGTL